MVSWSGDDDDIARELDEEPQVSVYVSDTGETLTLGLEEYIQGVVAGEMFPDWPTEAYAAQAILARSFTLAFIAEGGLQEKYGTDVSTNIEEVQAYNPDAITPEIKQGVEMTRGEVMTHDGRLVKGWFHAYSGGITASAKEGLDYQEEEPPYIKSVDLPDNEYAPEDVTNWMTEYTEGELLTLLRKAGLNLNSIADIRIADTGPTKRVTKIEIETADGQVETISGPEFRLAVDSTRMKSTLVNVFEYGDGVLKIEGTGYGHGVGLSQWDAFKMAKDGKNPEEIVTSFFNEVEIKKLYQ